MKTKTQLRMELTHLAAMVGELKEWERGQVVELPSPAIPGRVDLVVIVLPYTESESTDSESIDITWPGGLIIRNQGVYSEDKSRKLAVSMGRLIRQLDPVTAGSIACYDDQSKTADAAGQWVDCVEHTYALAKLRKIDEKPKVKVKVTRRKVKK